MDWEEFKELILEFVVVVPAAVAVTMAIAIPILWLTGNL